MWGRFGMQHPLKNSYLDMDHYPLTYYNYHILNYLRLLFFGFLECRALGSQIY